MALINTPPGIAVDALDGVSAPWRNFFTQVYRLLVAMQGSGSTANRPTSLLWTGRAYYDTTITKPVWWDGSAWRDATGAPA